ncbi:MAG: Gfo/Idh/MocA family protein, partial [Chloroflexota bacterium]
MGSIRVAIIGCGGMGRTHARTLVGLADAEVALLVDPLSASVERLQREVGLEDVPSTGDAAAALSDGRIDAVVIATHHDLHPPLAIGAAEVGKHVFVEKPLALTLEGCRAIERAAARGGVQVVVGFQARHCPYVKRGRAAVPHPRVLAGQMIDPKWGDGHWAQDPVTGGGNVLSQGVHTFDLLCHLAGEEPVAIHAAGGTFTHDPATTHVVDTVVATIRFRGGAVASVAIGDFGPSHWAGKSFYQLFDATGRSATVYQYYGGLRLGHGRETTDVTSADLSPAEQADPFGYVGEMAEFVACARERRSPTVAAGVQDGTRATKLALAAFES